MPAIRPITDLRNTSAISELCHKLNEPVFITKNGSEDMVIMSSETYDRTLAAVNAADICRELLVSIREISENKGVDGYDVLKEMKKKYNYDV